MTEIHAYLAAIVRAGERHPNVHPHFRSILSGIAPMTTKPLDSRPRHYSHYAAIRWLGPDGGVRTGVLVQHPIPGQAFGLAYDPQRAAFVWLPSRESFEFDGKRDDGGALLTDD